MQSPRGFEKTVTMSFGGPIRRLATSGTSSSDGGHISEDRVSEKNQDSSPVTMSCQSRFVNAARGDIFVGDRPSMGQNEM
jgi:hypothetical protein